MTHGCITIRRCVAYIHDPDTTSNFDCKVKFIGFLTWFCVRPIPIFFNWHWFTIFGTWVYHQEKMWHVHSCSLFDVDLWPQGHIYRLLSCLHVRPVTSLSFDIGIPYLTHGSIIMRGCVKYIHCPDTSTLTFYLKVKFIGFMTWLYVQTSGFFLSFDIVILCLARECIPMIRCVAYIYELCMTLTFDLNIKIIFPPWIWVWQDVFALWHSTKVWHMGVSPWDNVVYILDLNMTLTFDLYVDGGGILSEFYSQFLSCLSWNVC